MLHASVRTESITERAICHPPEPRYPTTGRPEHSNETEAKENNLKNSLMKMMKILKEKLKKNLLKKWRNKQSKNWKKSIKFKKFLKECQENQ